MVLVTLLGWLVQHFGGADGAVVPALLLGMVVANFVPAKAGCAVPQRGGPR